MKEIIGLENISMDNWLKDYNLRVFEGEIVCVQSASNTGLAALMAVLEGSRRPDTGRIFIDEICIADYSERRAREKGIYVLQFENYYGKNLKVLDVVLPLRQPWSLYSERKEGNEIRRYLEKEKIDLNPEAPVWKLNRTELRKLQILRARLQMARLIVINLEQEKPEGKLEEELLDMVQKMKRKGTTFLILSCCYTAFLEIASRVQFLYLGRAVKEWDKIPEDFLERLRLGNLMYKKTRELISYPFIGMYDYEWDTQNGFWDYLECVKRNNPAIWKKYFLNVTLPVNKVGYRNGAAVIPGDSKELLLDNLSVGENLTLAAKSRTNYGRTAIINPRLQKKLTEGFLVEYELPGRMEELTNVQRKIVSIGRYEILKPQIIFLELPYQGIGLGELPELHRYLYHLVKKGIRVVYFSQSMEMLQENCRVIIRTRNGISAKIDTFS